MPCGIRGQVLSQTDSIEFSKVKIKNSFLNNIFQQAVNSVRRTPDTTDGEIYLNGKSEYPYLPYEGKIIRHIYVEPLNFDRNFEDTSARDNSFGARLGNRLHRSTRKFVIRNNLFIRENTPVNPYMMADNERFIRSLEYIHDARIVVTPVKGKPDSVDVTVYTKDIFSIGGGAATDLVNRGNVDLYDANLAGMGQRLDMTGLYDKNRDPNFGYGGFYRKNNVCHSYIDATIGYSVMNVSPYTHEEESTHYFTLYRQLVSPYSRFAGGLTLSENSAVNLYHLPDSTFFKYKYELLDGWAGYNLGIKKLTASNNTVRDRRFLAIRYYQRNFTEVPSQVGEQFNPVYNSSKAILGQITFFRQDYYKTQYIYGFGTTEDLPYGYNIAITGGWHQQLGRERPYAGVKASQFIATNYGDFIQLYFRSGGFMYKNEIEDGSFLIGASAFSRIFFINSTKIRQYINISYTHLYNRVTYPQLQINNYFGPRGFLSDSAYGNKRLSLQMETDFFLKCRILGFQFTPFPYGDLSLITPENQPFSKSNLYSSLGGGIRTRNENLAFDAIEIRAFFFPIAPQNMRGFKIVTVANLRYRYSSNYITAPDLVQLNAQ